MVKLEKKFREGHIYMQWIFVLLANCTFFTIGLESGWMSPTTKFLQSENSPTGEAVSNNALSWIASSFSMASIFGVSIYTFILEYFGRKKSIIFIAVPQVIGWAIRLCYSTTITLILSRVFTGLSCGGCSIIIPLYVKEISQDDMRGVFGTFVVLSPTVGLLFIYIIGAYCNYYTVILINLVISIVTTILVLKLPESPAFLVKQGKYDEATVTMAYLRGLGKDDQIVNNIIDRIKHEEALFKSLPNISFFSLLRNKSSRRGFYLSIATFVFQGFNGAYVITTYASTILVSTGIQFDISPEIQTFSFPVFIIVGSLWLTASVEKYGRKPLLIGAFLITALSMAAIAFIVTVQERGWNLPSWLALFAMTITMCMYGAGVGPLPYIITTELLNFQIRTKVMGLVITLAWFLLTIVISTYTSVINYIGPYAPFIFYAFVNFMGSVFTFLYIPETKAKTEEEISAMLEDTK